jgi:hypothetical protein
MRPQLGTLIRVSRSISDRSGLALERRALSFLDHAERIPYSFVLSFAYRGPTGDAVTYAVYSPTVRAWSERTITRGLMRQSSRCYNEAGFRSTWIQPVAKVWVNIIGLP